MFYFVTDGQFHLDLTGASTFSILFNLFVMHFNITIWTYSLDYFKGPLYSDFLLK